MVIRGFRDDSVSNFSDIETSRLAESKKSGSDTSSSKGRSKSEKSIAQRHFRKSLIESLEVRNLMAGPQLIGIQPNNSDLIEEGVIRNVAPRELTFRFDESQIINPNTTGGIRLTRSGGDGTFGLNSLATDFGSGGKVDIQLTMKSSGQALTINVLKADLGGGSPRLVLNGTTLNVTLNSNVTTPTTAGQLVNAINSDGLLQSTLSAAINGGFADAALGVLTPTGFGPLRIDQTNDQIVTPASSVISNAPKQNEVKLQFAETLLDDAYRIEVFGFDNQQAGIIGLRNTAGELFVPRAGTANRDTFNFRLDLGSKILGVVPQPVVRNAADGIEQRRNQIVVYFDNDKLLVENDASGSPTLRSAENTDFYQLIYTADTIRNTDDTSYNPTRVTYNASANLVTLEYFTYSGVQVVGTVAPGALIPANQLSQITSAGRTIVPYDINNLKPSGAANVAFRLRVGTRESLPFVPTRLETSATAVSDLNTNGAARLKFTSRLVGEGAAAISVNFSTNPAASSVGVSVAGNIVSVTMAPTSTAMNVISAIRASAVASALIDVSLEEGLGGATVVGSRPINYSPVRLVGLGDTFTTATNVGTIGSQVTPLSSFIFTSDIKNTILGLDNLGASNDPAHRDLGAGNFDNHINSNFGADSNPGITKIYYNFRSDYGIDSNGVPLTNSISVLQQTRTREALQAWSRYLGVQFVETPNTGITIATGSRDVLNPFAPNVRTEDPSNFRVRIDPTFANGLLVLESGRAWNENYGEDYYRHVVTGIGMLLGLTRANDLPASTLLAMNRGFLDGNGGPSNQESVFPGAQDILHGQFIHKADNSDIDLYRFEVNFGENEPGRVGAFEAETFSERAEQASSLDTYLMLYRETQAVAVSNFGATNGLGVKFTAVQPGKLGNNLQIFVSRSAINSSTPGFSNNTVVQVFPSLISIELNSTANAETTVDQLLAALQNNPAVRALVNVELTSNSPVNAGTTKIGLNETSYSPITLLGGGMELIAQNDNYFSEDSLLRLSLGSGVYYLGVSAAGNSTYDPAIANSGTGGRTEGRYDLRMTFRAQTDAEDSITDTSTRFVGDQSQSLDGDADGLAGGVYDFWFETRPLNRVVSVNAGGSASLENQVISITGANGVTRRLEFSADPFVSVGNTRIPYAAGSPSTTINADLINAINSLTAATGINATAIAAPGGSTSFTLVGDRTISIPPTVTILDVAGKTIFVDKLAGPNADGSLASPFNNIQSSTVANAFGSALPGDIVRIVGNGGNDRNLSTVGDNVAYEFGFGLLGNVALTDGVALEVPQGVIAMVDAGAIFKSRRSRIAVGSSNGNIDRSGASLQILGTPVLVSNNTVLRDATGQAAPGSVFFTSWLDETIGRDSYGPSTIPGKGDWGGIVLQRDIDRAAAKLDKEDNGIFLNYVNFADIRYGGGGGVVIDSVQQVVNPIQIIDGRPTISYNSITRSADAAVSASPNSFEETIFTDKIYQSKGAFTPDYDRVGPSIHDNRLVDNSVNGLFIGVATLPGDTPKNFTVAGRFDDIDITHVLSENLILNGTPGGNILDFTRPTTQFMVPTPTIGGTLPVGSYNYKATFVDSFGNESIPSPATPSITLNAGQNAVDVQGIPSVLGAYTSVRLYRSRVGGIGPYDLIAQLNSTANSFVDRGVNLGGTLSRDQLDVSGLSSTDTAGGSLALGSYTYKVVMIDIVGREGLASDASGVQLVANPANRTLELTGIPLTTGDYVGRRIYRSDATGGGTYRLIGELLNASSASISTFTDNGSVVGGILAPDSIGVIRSRLDSSLVIDPGSTLKIEGARIELGQGTQLLAEGTENLPIIITSKLDDSAGAGGTFDSNNDGTLSRPAAGNWGGIFAAPGSRVSLDYTTIAYGGGVTRLEGTFRAFNALEIQQADARIAHSTFRFNANGVGGQGSQTRFGRLANEQATVLIRGSSPIFVDNVFDSNTSNVANSVSSTRSAAISIDANSMTNVLQGDIGRMTGSIDRLATRDTNRGPLFRGNQFNNNDLNGLKIRADNRSDEHTTPLSQITPEPVTDINNLPSDALTVESVWDDTDIVHVLYDGIFIENQSHVGSLSLLSSSTESLVVKMIGSGSNFDPLRGTGFTASGTKSSINDRVGGSIYVIGQPGFPVILTSLRDDTAGAGLGIDGNPKLDTNNDGIGSIPRPGDWRGILLDQNSNDRNVALVPEQESVTSSGVGSNGSVLSAQVLGQLAASATNSDENLRLGFVVRGVLSQPGDVDVYSFTGTAGTEVWIDVDNTTYTLDSVIELLDANGNLLARSDNSIAETIDPSLIVKTSGIASQRVNPLNKQTVGDLRFNANGIQKEDGTTNVRDAGLRVFLPGAVGTTTGYFFRIRSASINANNVNAGLTSGVYQVQVRMREAQEFPGSMVTGADIRYATNGIHLRGLPAHSPLLGEAKEDESVRPRTATSPVTVADSQTFANNDVPWSYWPRKYNGAAILGGTPFTVVDSQPESNGVRPQYVGNVLNSDLATISVAGNLVNQNDVDFYRFSLTEQDVANNTFSLSDLSFDIDYADGLNRPDASLAVYALGGTPGHETWRLIYVGDGSNIAEDQRLPLSGTNAQELSRGSFGASDPFINANQLLSGDYLVAVHSAARVPSEFEGTSRGIIAQQNIISPLGDFISVDLSTYTAADLPAFNFSTVGLAANISYTVTVTDSIGNVQTFTVNGTGSFQFSLASFVGDPNVTISFPTTVVGGGGPTTTTPTIQQVAVTAAERAARRVPMFQIASAATPAIDLTAAASARTILFDLSGYVKEDLPSAYFDYSLLNAADLTVQVVSSKGTQTNPFISPLDATGRARQAKIDLGIHAGANNVRIIFSSANPTLVNITNVIVGFAERGERVVGDARSQDSFFTNLSTTSGNSGFFYSTQSPFINQLFTTRTTPNTSTLLGDYQLEIRKVSPPTITNTNDRVSFSSTLIVPSSAGIVDGQVFTISDGANSVEFEFNLSGGVGVGRVAIVVNSGDSSAVIATRIRDAINNPGVQSRFLIRAAGSDGLVTGPLTGDRVNLFGSATVSGFFSVLNSNLLTFGGEGDENATREQGQIIISGNFIRYSRDYGVWSESGSAEYDKRDLVDTFSVAGNLVDGDGTSGTAFNPDAIIQPRPTLSGSSPGPARNLQQSNNSVLGGFNTGIVITNNVLEQGGLGGVQIAGENPIWMITPPVPTTDNTYGNTIGTHTGSIIFDADLFWFTNDRTRVGFEFEDIAGAPTGLPDAGSGLVQGNGVDPDHVPVFYRDDAGGAYLRDGVSPFPNAWGSTGLELLHSFRDSINGSILVTNGTTQVVKATVAQSLLQASPIIVPAAAPQPTQNVRFQTPLPIDNYLQAIPGVNYSNRPALYLEGVSGVYFQTSREKNVLRNPWDIRRVDKAESTQPFARIVNNTIIGNDGQASFNPDATVSESNDTISTAVQTQQGTGHTPLGFTMNARIGDNPTLRDPTTDVDFYQFKLDIGDRVQIDIDSPVNGGVDTTLQLFDSSGRLVPVRLSNGTLTAIVEQGLAPDETAPPNIDPYLDYTSVSPGVYYAGVSASGNTGFDPQSLVTRLPGSGTGSYTIGITVLHPQTFTITVEDPASYVDGQTFEIAQIADLAAPAGNPSLTNSRIFEFTRGNGVAPGNIPVFIGPDYRQADVARSIAGAIRNSGLNNTQQLANGINPVTGANRTASPLNPVTAFALGGQDGVAPSSGGTGQLGGFGGINPGIRIFPLREDGFFVEPARLSSFGFGNDLLQTGRFGTGPTAADGMGTTERFVVIENAAWIRSNGNIRVDPDFNDRSNLDQLLPETGIMVSSGASPTILNNVFYNLQTPIVQEESRSTFNGGATIDYLAFNYQPAAFGSTNRDFVIKPGQTIIGGSVYQFSDNGTVARNRQLISNRDQPIGIEVGPTNVPNTGSDFNFTALATDQLFVNAQAGQYLPARGSRLIDSSIDSLTERSSFDSIKRTSGIAASPIIAPSRDGVGQLRVDDPEVSPPQGLGANVFKDRGALDRSDFVGPTAKLLVPIDNDSNQVDRDPASSFVQLQGGVYPEFRIQLSDSLSDSDPFPGVGVDDDTVVGPNQAPVRLPGAALTITEDGRTLVEGIDYSFGYNPTTKEIILTPLAGVWRNNRVYEITLNNRDRFVLNAVSGEQVDDGTQFQVVDSNGGVVTFEYDSGYRLQLPQGLSLTVPVAGAGAGGIADGSIFRLSIPNGALPPRVISFELDSNFTSDAANIRIPFLTTDNAAVLSSKLLDALNTANTTQALGIQPKLLSPTGPIFIGAPSGTLLSTANTAFAQPASTLAIVVPVAGAQVGGVTDGQSFVLFDGTNQVTFEFDSNNNFTLGRTPVNLTGAFTATDVANAIRAAIATTNLAIAPLPPSNTSPTNPSGSLLYLNLPSTGTVDVRGSNLSVSGISRNLNSGDSITVTNGAVTKTFIFTTIALPPAVDVIQIPITAGETQDEIGVALATAIQNAGLNLQPRHLGNGNIAVGGTNGTLINISPNANVGLFGQPGVTTATTLDLNGTLVLNVPVTGGSLIPDNRRFTITNNGRTVTFEFDRDSSGPTTAGNITIPFVATNTSSEMAALIASAISTSTLGITPRILQTASNAEAKIDLGLLPTTAVDLLQSSLTTSRGAPVDGEFFTVNSGTQTVVFEFDNTALNNGISANRRSIAFNDSSTQAQIAASIVASINGANLGIIATSNGNVIQLNDKPTFTYVFGTSPSLGVSGLAGGAKPVVFTRDPSFTSVDMRIAIVKAINAAADTTLQAGVRSGNALYIDNAVSLSANTSNYFLRGIQDLADNNLQATRQNGETQFTILMPGTVLDFGNAPDPFTNAAGRYATTFDSDGARHVVIGNSEVQQVGWDAGTILGGTFTLTHIGQTTAAIAANATAADVKAALEALPAIGSGNVIVTTLPQLSGSANVRYELTFVGTRTSLNVPQTTIDISLLTGNSVKSAVAETKTEGNGGVRLGAYVSGELDATITPTGSGDTGNDGVTFVSSALSVGTSGLPVFNRNVSTFITVTASAPGFLSTWIDFNGDGDWEDANELIDFNNSLALVASGKPVNNFLEFTIDKLTQVIEVTVPSTAPVPISPINAFARFRFSSTIVLLPTGLATDGEVEDYGITIVGGNPPVAVDVAYSMVEDQSGGLQVSNAIGLLSSGNVTDPDGPSRVGFSVELIDAPIHSANTFVLNANGSFTYTPEADYFGSDSFTYRVYDGILGSLNIGTVTLTIQPVNDAPVVPQKNVNSFKNQSYTVSASDLLNLGNTTGPANESNQSLSLSAVSTNSTAGGTVTFINGNYVYQPPVNFVGPDSFTYLVVDNGTTAGNTDPLTTTGTVAITVADRNTPPVAGPDQFSTVEDPEISSVPPVVRGVARPFSFFTGNDSASDGLDPNEVGQTISLTGVSPTSAAGGTVTIQGGNVIYIPPANFNGTDTFTYTITDTGTPPASSVGTVTVTVTGENDDPTQLIPLGTLNVAEDSVIAPLNLGLYFTDPDLPYGDVLTYSIESNSNAGLVSPSISAGGQLLLPLVLDQNGTSSIVVRATDLLGRSVTNTLTLVVLPATDSAKSASQIPTQNVNEDAPPIDIVLAPTFFFNPDNIANPAAGLTYIASSSNTNLVRTSIVNGVLRLTLQPNAFGNASITVSANNGTGPAVQTFNVNVASVNDGPTSVADVYNVPANFVLRATDVSGGSTGITNDNGVLANDSDVEGNSFTARLVSQPTRGVLTFANDGTFTYLPNNGSVPGQSDTFTYIATDSLGTDGAETTVTLNFSASVVSPHQNPDTRWQFVVGNGISSPDVNADGFVSPIDALLIINYLNERNSERRVPFLTYTPQPFRDVNGDMFITPLDIVQVINFLNARSRLGNGEGESVINSSSGTIIAAAPAISGVSSWSTNVLNSGNNMLPMQDVSAAAVTGGYAGSAVPKVESSVDQAMSVILNVNPSDADSEFDNLAAGRTVSDSAFDLAISDLFDSSKKKIGGK